MSWACRQLPDERQGLRFQIELPISKRISGEPQGSTADL